MAAGYAVDILDELAASIIRTEMSGERKCSHCVVIWSSDPWDGREGWCHVWGSRNSGHGNETERPYSGSQYRPKGNSTCCNKVFLLLSLVKMLTTLFNLRHCVLSCVRYSGSICVHLSFLALKMPIILTTACLQFFLSDAAAAALLTLQRV